MKTDKLEHTYKSVFGYFDFEEVYLEQVRKAEDGHKFVEIGCFFGKSSCFFGVEIKNSNKKISLDCIDYWDLRGGVELSSPAYGVNNCGYSYQQHGPDIMFEVFNKNINNAQISDVITARRMSSSDASNLYENESLDFIFIDADHSYASVLNDLKIWLPKLKNNRSIAGHDYSWSGVRQAVNEFFGEKKVRIVGDSWIFDKYEN